LSSTCCPWAGAFVLLNPENNITAENVQNRAADFLDECSRVQKIDVKCIVVAACESNVRVYLVETSEFGAFSSPIDTLFRCIGERTPLVVAEHYLEERDHNRKKCEAAAPEILAILKRACKEGSYVGAQEDYGLDIIIVRNGDYFCRTRVTTDWATLTNEIRPIDGAPPQFTFTPLDGGAA